MINSLFQGILDWLRQTYLSPTLSVLKLSAGIYYLEGVRRAHRILILICTVIFVLTLVGAGFVIIPLALLVFMPWEPTTKAVVGIVIGLFYLLIPAVALLSLLSEKRWMRLTGATALLRKLVE